MPILGLTAVLEGNPVPLETLEDMEAFHQFLRSYLSGTRPACNLTVEPDVTPAPKVVGRLFGDRNPPPGERIIDYAERVLREYPEGLTSLQTANKMLALGWKTRSDNARRLVHIRLSDLPDRFVRTKSKKWVLRTAKED